MRLTKQHWLWLIWLCMVLAVLWVLALAAARASPTLPQFQKQKHAKYVTPMPRAGLGAEALIAREVVIPPPKPIGAPFYFAATANADGLESDFSNEAIHTNTLALIAKSVTLSWDPSPSTNVGITYKVYRGRVSGRYDTNFNAGTNLTLTVPLSPPVLTNIVIHVTSVNATNLQWRLLANSGSWTKLGATNYTATNPATRFWRAMSKSKNTPSQVFIKKTFQ